MNLNLDSLKNLSDTSTTPSSPAPEKEISTESLEMADISEAPAPASPLKLSGQKCAPVNGPKISLLKLKQASWVENSTVPTTETKMSKKIQPEETFQEEEIKDISTPTIQKKTLYPRITARKTETSEVSTVENRSIEKTAEEKPTEQTSSIETDAKTGKSEKNTPENIGRTESKEFFPNFRVTDSLDLENDLLDLPDTITITECPEVPSLTTEHGDTPSDEDNTPVVCITSDEENTPIISAATTESETSVVITPEYVAEVKAELSENRRAWFRFLMKKKSKIIAGVSLVLLSVSAAVFFSLSWFPQDIRQSWKTDIQGNSGNGASDSMTSVSQAQESASTQQEPSKAEAESGMQTSVTPASDGYEMGVDYSVIKNTKKNLHSKASSGSFQGTK